MNDGDDLTVQAGTQAWSNHVSITNQCITITGAGNSSSGTKLTYSGSDVHYFFLVNNTGKNCSSNPLDISGFYFTRTGGQQVQGYIRIFGTWNAGQFRIHGNRFENTAHGGSPDYVLYVNGTLGVIDSNVFQGESFGVINWGRGETDWNNYASFAMGGATGGAGGDALFIEGNTFNYPSNCFGGTAGWAALDMYSGGHVVFRFNTLINSYAETHDIARSGLSVSNGFLLEAYRNTFSNACPGSQWKAFDIAGGTGANFLNTFNSPVTFGVGLTDYRTEAYLPLGSQAGGICNGSSSIDQNTSGQTGWRCYGQVGTAGLGASAVTWAFHSFGNVCNSSCGSANAVVHDFQPNPGGQAASVHIVANRDYEIGTTGTTPPGTCNDGDVFWETDAGEWDSTNGSTPDGRSWVCVGANNMQLRYGGRSSNTTGLPYEYPHPLRMGVVSVPPVVSAPAPATNIRITAPPITGPVTTWYVATTGNNSYTCNQAQNPGTPKLTIAAALACVGFGAGAGADDVVQVANGTYAEAITALPEGTSGHPFVLRAASQYGAVIKPNSGSVQVFTFDRSYVTLRNFKIDGDNVSANTVVVNGSLSGIIIEDNEVLNTEIGDGTGIGSFQGIYVNSSGTIIRRNYIHDIGSGAANHFNHGIYINNASNVTVDSNVIHRTGGQGMQAFGGTQNNITATNNRISDWAQSATGGANSIYIEGDNAVVYNNVLFQLSSNANSYGLAVIGSSNVVYNNTMVEIANEGIQLVGTSTVRNNLLYNIGSTPIYQISGTHTVNTNLEDTADPLFANLGSFDFHLTSSSPARNAGATIAAVTRDIAGTSRPQEGTYDLGAYEFIP